MTQQSSYRIRQLADYIQADVEGEDDYVVDGLASLGIANERQLAFYTNSRYKQYLSITSAGCVLLKPSDKGEYNGNKLISEDPYLAYARLTELFSTTSLCSKSVHESAIIAANVSLDKEVTIGANVVIESGSTIGRGAHLYPGCYIGADTKIGSNTVLYPNVTVYQDTSIGNNCIIHSSSVIGSDGFGFAPSKQGWQKIYQLGGVQIGDNVEIGAGTTVDRGALENTMIGDGVKIDNQVQIAHNVQVGDQTAIAAAVAIAGSAIIGKRCTIAGGVGIVGHVIITDDVHVTAMTMITKSIEHSGSYSSGVPMSPTREWRKNAVRFNHLDKMARCLKSIKK